MILFTFGLYNDLCNSSYLMLILFYPPRIRKRCCDSWLTLAILVSVVLAAQAWVLLYFTMGCASVYKPGGHVVVKDEAGKVNHVETLTEFLRH